MGASLKKKESLERNGTLLVDAEEIGAMLGTSRRHVLDLAARDRLPHVRIGRFVRFRRESIEKWVDQDAERWPNGKGAR